MNIIIAIITVCIMTGCQSYASFVNTFNDRQISSCIEGNVNVGYMSASGMLHVYTATGGAKVTDCIAYFKNMTAPQQP